MGFKIEIPLPKWAIAGIGVIVILASAGAGAFFTFKNIANSVIVPKDQLSVYQATQFHALSDPEDHQDIIIKDFPDEGATLTIRHYHSDGCVQVIRFNHALKRGDSKWLFAALSTHLTGDGTKSGDIRDPPKLPQVEMKAKVLETSLGGPISPGWHNLISRNLSTAPTTANFILASESSSHKSDPVVREPLLEAARGKLEATSEPQEPQMADPVKQAIRGLLRQSADSFPATFANYQGGRCMDPHPGAFGVTNQQVNQCIVQVWRNFQDGCTHFQYFNACTGSWDVYPNGAPHVTWTRCVH